MPIQPLGIRTRLQIKFCALLTMSLLMAGSVQGNELNDTGVTHCFTETDDDGFQVGDPSGSSLDGSNFARQDCRFGRDAAAGEENYLSAPTLVKEGVATTGLGLVGFDFTPLDASGNALASFGGHSCVQDNVTGLVWEVKTTDGGLRDQGWSYTWYSSATYGDGTANGFNGGDPGMPEGSCVSYEENNNNYTSEYCGVCYPGSTCDTAGYVAEVNANGGICGYTDWRLPTLEELRSIVDYSEVQPAMNTTAFPNTLYEDSEGWAFYWTATTDPQDPGKAFAISMYAAGEQAVQKSEAREEFSFNVNGIRLVRGGQ